MHKIMHNPYYKRKVCGMRGRDSKVISCGVVY